MKLSNKEISDYIQTFLNEDKFNKDITSKFFIKKNQNARANFVAEDDIILAGNSIVIDIFKRKCKKLKIIFKLKDGKRIKRKTKFLIIEGNARDILSIERTALNLLQHLSGISTLTEKYSRKTKKVKTILLDTRKTIPGLRNFEKYAAVMGGAKNHRFNLGEKYMIKDNHLNLTKEDVYNKILKMNKNTKKLVIIECDTLIQVKKALDCGVKHLLLDNMSLNNIKKAKKNI